MIFVTVGNSNIGFDRLIQKMDEISSHLPYRVVMQIGASNYIPKNAEWFRYSDYKSIISYFEMAKLIVTHAGAGTILDILLLGKIPIVVPRLKEFGEVIDNHQLEITKILAEKELIVPVYDIQRLENTILSVLTENLKSNKKKRTAIQLKYPD